MSKFVKDLVERVVSSAAGGAVLALGGGALNVYDLDWKVLLGGAAGAGLFSFFKCLAAFKFVGDDDAAFLPKGG